MFFHKLFFEVFTLKMFRPELYRLKELLILETAAKERIEREKENVKKELDEERRRPNQE